MKKLISLTIQLLFFCIAAQAQYTLSAHVFDSKTQEPISGVLVYLDGSSSRTTTDVHGHFTLEVPLKVKSNLVLSHVSYAIMAVGDPFTSLDKKLYMNYQETSIDAVIVDGNAKTKRAYGPDRMMSAFKTLFFGTTDAGKSCEILNPDDVFMLYDQESGVLTAHAEKPIKYNNAYLGYTVEFTLINFKAEYYVDSNTLSELNTGESSFTGMSVFTDNFPDDTKYEKRRNETFGNSPTYFFKHLVQGTLYDLTPYRVYSGNKIIYPEEYFYILDTMSHMFVMIRPQQQAYDKANKRLPKGAYGSLFVTIGAGITSGTAAATEVNFVNRDISQPRRATNLDTMDVNPQMKSLSTIYFFKPAFFVDYSGLVEDPNVVRFSGYLGQIKAGDMLPDDYKPKPFKSKKEAIKEGED